MDERSEILDSLFKALERRKESVEKVFVGFALSRNEKGELKLCFGHLHFLGRTDAIPEPVTYDYRGFILVRRMIEVDEAIALIRSIFKKGCLEIEGWRISLKARPGELDLEAPDVVDGPDLPQ